MFQVFLCFGYYSGRKEGKSKKDREFMVRQIYKFLFFLNLSKFYVFKLLVLKNRY